MKKQRAESIEQRAEEERATRFSILSVIGNLVIAGLGD